jgi:imidazoleglycerol-phosphate dehydratase/histidinol-phosphatase
MSGERILFIDRDGTIIEEPSDEQVDSLQKLRLLPGVIPALLELQRAGYRLVLVSNQDGLGTASFPEPTFREPQDFLRTLLASQGIAFDAEFFCPHFPSDGCDCRKPRTGLLTDFLKQHVLDPAHSYVIGDRDTDMQLATNLGIEGLRVRADGAGGATWDALVQRLCRPNRSARVVRKTKETEIEVRVALDRAAPVAITTGIGFFDHMLEQVARHGGFALELRCTGDLEVDEHHTVEDCALALGQALREALGDKRGIARYGFLLPMDESLAQVAIDLSGRAYAVFEGKFRRESVGGLPTELVPHFFRSLADSLGAAIHVQVRGENSHHMVEACFKGVGRALRQALRIEGTELPSSKGVL